jgi:hypothetical protein
MQTGNWEEIEKAKKAAIEVLLHNSKGPFQGLPRTAGWGYPEPYTRDLMLSMLGIGVSGNSQLIETMRKTLITLAGNQTTKGHIPSLVHDPEDRGSSDTTPLFLLAVGIFRIVTAEDNFLVEEVNRSLLWMEYQSPSDRYLIGQLPTSDWRDEQWVLGYGLYVNAVAYSYLRLLGQHHRADKFEHDMQRFTITGSTIHHHIHAGLVVKHKPYFALWAYKVYSSERFDLLGNSIAILSGLASKSRAQEMISWIEAECEELRKKGDLVVNLPPNFFPFIQPEDPDWIPRYKDFNLPGDYHNGGIWPFIAAFYVAALVAAGRLQLAKQKLFALTEMVKLAQNNTLEFGFNEWHKAQDGLPHGQDWQTWSAALYLYAAKCVEEGKTPFFEEMRK